MNTPVHDRQDPETLEREVDKRRASLNQTLNAVEERLSPNRLMEQTMEYFGQHGGDIAQSVSRSIKNNPIPLLLTGVGIAWLMSSQSRNNSQTDYDHQYRDQLTRYDEGAYRSDGYRNPYYRSNLPVGDRSHEDESYYSEANQEGDSEESLRASIGRKAEQWTQTADELKDDFTSQLRSMKQGAEESADEWRERVISASVEQAESMQYRMQRSNQQFSRQARNQAQNAKDFMQEQPLVVGALGIAAGALIGALLPSTAVEDKMIGAKADEVKSTLADKADSVSDDVSSAVSEKAQTLREKGEEKINDLKREKTSV